MTSRTTPRSLSLTEQNKARARLVLLVLITAVLSPFAGARSALVWVLYLAFAALYSLWSMRLVRRFRRDRRLGYLLCATDTAVLLPLLVWTSSPFVRTGLILLCAGGFVFTYAADRVRGRADTRVRSASSPGEALLRQVDERIRLFQVRGERFALVMLRVLRLDEIKIYYGQEEADRTISALERRGLRLLGPDGQCFVLSGGRMAFVFSLTRDLTLAGAMTASERLSEGSQLREGPRAEELIYDVEGLAMKLARLVCERSVDGHRVACSVGWASCPADGVTAEDLLYVADTGARSTDVFRQVGTAPVAVAESRRAAG
ncbi:MAG: hypothetical protein N3B14_08235 [Thermoleophilia bacterium]|nr:hypothetical protein [Thermoleophilia bacterium]